MTNQIDYIEFPADTVEKVSASRDFFTKAFGWNYKQWGEEYVDTQDSGITSGVSISEPSAAPLAVIRTTDIKATYDEVLAAGGTITKEIFSFPGGQRFHFTEPAGNELAVWSE